MATVDHSSGDFREVNEALLKYTQYTKEAFLNLSFWDITPSGHQLVWGIIKAIFGKKANQSFERAPTKIAQSLFCCPSSGLQAIERHGPYTYPQSKPAKLTKQIIPTALILNLLQWPL